MLSFPLLTRIFLGAAAGFAAPLLSPEGKYELTAGQDPAVAIAPLAARAVDVSILYESFAPERKEPLVRSETTQRLLIRELPAEAGFTRRELVFKKFKTSTRMQLPGARKPFVNSQDLGAYLAQEPVRARLKGAEFASFENLAELREKLERRVKDPLIRQGLRLNLSDDSLRAVLSSSGGEPVCVDGLKGRAPGARWERARVNGNVALNFQCEFAGWSEAGGRRLLVVKFTMPKQRSTRAQPNGTPAEVENEGSGTIVAEPLSGETLVRLETEVFAQPTAEETRALEKKGRAVPKNRSVVRTSTHAYVEAASAKLRSGAP